VAIDLMAFGNKLERYRKQFNLSFEEISNATGISLDRMTSFEAGQVEPTGDEILIFADYFKCDYKFFISNEKLAAFEQTELLFRKHGEDLSSEDRWSIQEFLFLAECEAFLQKELHKNPESIFDFHPTGQHFKTHARDAADSLRHHLGFSEKEVLTDGFMAFRNIGFHIFRRRLKNSSISGFFIHHPNAGKCVLVNYSEDIFRQNFTLCHEAAHAIFDYKNEFVISFSRFNPDDLVEIRANAFASNFLLPPKILLSIPEPDKWDESKAINWATKFQVNTEVLANALSSANIIDKSVADFIKSFKVPRDLKIDPELSGELPPKTRQRKEKLIEHGLSMYYVHLCFEAYRQGIVSLQKVAEMMVVEESDLVEIMQIYGEKTDYAL
jgi:Zn-dependent peptidase ImmA (M78 family)/transcriptional regulator with XRE-family HTH domain